MTSRVLLGVFSTAVLVLATFPVGGQIQISTKEAVDATVRLVPCDQKMRLDGVKKLFASFGADDSVMSTEQFDKGKITNLIVRKPGKTDDTIIIGAHYDRTDKGCGALDNWTGITVMGHIYKTLRPLTTDKSYIFVAFDQEEEGLKGSEQMVKAMKPADLAKTCSMVNFDSFGQAYPMALRSISSAKMLKLAEALGKENKFTFHVVEIPGASSDSASFLEKKVPSITLSGLAGNWTEYLHTSNDKLSNVNLDSVYVGYRFGLQYLAKLDQTVCSDLR